MCTYLDAPLSRNVASAKDRSKRLRTTARILASATAIMAAIGGAGTARAGGMDPTPERLVLQPAGVAPPFSCQSIAANPQAAANAGLISSRSYPACVPDDVAFANMVSELGFAIAPTAFHPARTTGIGGFALTVEASYTKINADDYST